MTIKKIIDLKIPQKTYFQDNLNSKATELIAIFNLYLPVLHSH